MMPTLSAAIMAHPDRAAMVDELRRDLDRDVPVVWDQIGDRHDTGVRSLENYNPSATHHLVLQDDALICRDLLAGTERALAHLPQDVPVCLYIGQVKPFRATIARAVQRATPGTSWLTMQGIYWGVGIVVPTRDLPELTAWFRGREGQRVTNYDRRVSSWYALRDATVWYPWPSLVDHRDGDSLVKGHGRGRHAFGFLGTDRSALEVDWTGGVVDLPRTDRMDDARQLRARRQRLAGRR